MSLQNDLDTIKGQLDSVDADSTKLADATTAIQAEITALLAQIPNAATLQQATDLATQATASVAKLTTIADGLTALGATPTT